MLYCRDIEELPRAPRTRQSLAESSKGAATSDSLLEPWDRRQEGAAAKEDSDGDMVMLDNDDAPTAPSDSRGTRQRTRSGGNGGGKAPQDAGVTHASGDPEPPDGAEPAPKRVGASPPRQKEGMVSCKAPMLAAALRRQQQRQDQQQDQQGATAKQQPKPQQQQHTAGVTPVQPSHSLSPSADPHRRSRKITEIYAADAAGALLPAPSEPSSSGGEAVPPKRQRTQHAADAQLAEQPSKPGSAAGGGPLSGDDGSPFKVAHRRSTGSSKGAGRRLGGSGAEAHKCGF